MTRSSRILLSVLAASAWGGPAGAQELGLSSDPSVGTAMALSIEPAFHFVNTSDSSASGGLISDGVGIGASARGMIFPLARPDGALGLGIQASAAYSQLFTASSGLLVGAGGLRYQFGSPRVAYWIDVNGGYGVASELGSAPYFDVGIGWQFALTPTFMWGLVGRWGFFFPQYEVEVAGGPTATINYSLLSIGLSLEWGPPRYREVAVAPVGVAQVGPQPYPMQGPQPVGPQPYAQPGMIAPTPMGPQPVQVQPQQPQVIPIATPQQPPQFQSAVGPADQDGDAIGDEADACPTFAEDQNGRDDNDGCPDADRDADGIPDATDQCAGRPEDFDAVRDEDGCPD